MASRQRILTFDCYNTLVDMSPLNDALNGIARSHARAADAPALRAAFYRIQREVTHGPEFLTLKNVLARSIQLALADFGLPAHPQDAEALIECYRAFPPFADVPPVMARLASSFDLCVMSNSDEDIIARNAERLGVPFTRIFTAEHLRCYKPDPRFFERVHHELGLGQRPHTHVAAGFWWDIIPGKRLDWRRIWVNRGHDQGDEQYQPYTEIHDFRELLTILDGP